MRLRDWYEGHRALMGKLFFEMMIVFIGVTAAFMLESARQRGEEARYRESMIAQLIPMLDDVINHNREFEAEVDRRLATIDAALARGETPKLSVYLEPGSERPPTRAWDGIVSTGAAKALDPKLLFDLASFYTRLDSFGERYIRYNDFTERRILSLGPDQAGVYDTATGELKPEYAAYVDRLRDLRKVGGELDVKARDLKSRLLTR